MMALVLLFAACTWRGLRQADQNQKRQSQESGQAEVVPKEPFWVDGMPAPRIHYLERGPTLCAQESFSKAVPSGIQIGCGGSGRRSEQIALRTSVAELRN